MASTDRPGRTRGAGSRRWGPRPATVNTPATIMARATAIMAQGSQPAASWAPPTSTSPKDPNTATNPALIPAPPSRPPAIRTPTGAAGAPANNAKKAGSIGRPQGLSAATRPRENAYRTRALPGVGGFMSALRPLGAVQGLQIGVVVGPLDVAPTGLASFGGPDGALLRLAPFHDQSHQDQQGGKLREAPGDPAAGGLVAQG